jgi:ketosteroid isomerase-like protein
MNTPHTASNLLQDYLQAISSGDVDAMVALLDERALVEIPFLKPNRLIGKSEIEKGHREILATLDSIDFKPTNIEANSRHAIAEGSLEIRRDGGETRHIAAGIVAEASDGILQRLSLYCDARHIRQWSDKTIL